MLSVSLRVLQGLSEEGEVVIEDISPIRSAIHSIGDVRLYQGAQHLDGSEGGRCGCGRPRERSEDRDAVQRPADGDFHCAEIHADVDAEGGARPGGKLGRGKRPRNNGAVHRRIPRRVRFLFFLWL